MRVVECEQGTPEWLEIKRGKISGTTIEQAYKGSESLLNQLIAERMITHMPEGFTSPAMDKGNALEPIARKMYMLNNSCDVEVPGFILHPERDDIGLSPDGVITGKRRAIEIKCPAWKTHVEYMRDDLPPKAYLFQLLNYFFCIPGLERVDFISYDELNEVRPMVVIPVTLDTLLDMEYLKGKKVGSMGDFRDRVFSFADKVDAEYNKIVF